jgi:hypothetical protein
VEGGRKEFLNQKNSDLCELGVSVVKMISENRFFSFGCEYAAVEKSVLLN